MSFNRQMRRQYEKNHRPELIAEAGRRVAVSYFRVRPRFVPEFLWRLMLRIVVR